MGRKRSFEHARRDYDQYKRLDKDATVGETRIPSCRRGDQVGWMLPGGVFTTSYADADAAARIIEAERARAAR